MKKPLEVSFSTTDIEQAFNTLPIARWKYISGALDLDGQQYELSLRHLFVREADIGNLLVPDSTPHSFLQAVAPAITPPQLFPTVSAVPSLDKKAGKANAEKAKIWTGILDWTYRQNNFSELYTLFAQDAAAFGISYLMVTANEEGTMPSFEVLDHDEVAFEPGVKRLTDSQWLAIRRTVDERSAKRLGLNVGKLTRLGADVSNATENQTEDTKFPRYVFYEVWDRPSRRRYIVGTEPVWSEPWPESYSDWPIVTLTFGNVPQVRYPFGLLYNWLPTKDLAQNNNTVLLVNALLVGMTPTLISNTAFTDTNAESIVDFYGLLLMRVPDAFFAEQGKAKSHQLRPEPLPSDFYAWSKRVEEKIQRESHIDDIMQAKQLRDGISKAEVEAIVAQRTQWFAALNDKCLNALSSFGQRVIECWGALLEERKTIKAISELSGGESKQVTLTPAWLQHATAVKMRMPTMAQDSAQARIERAQALAEVSTHQRIGPFVDDGKLAEAVLEALDAGEMFNAKPQTPTPPEVASAAMPSGPAVMPQTAVMPMPGQVPPGAQPSVPPDAGAAQQAQTPEQQVLVALSEIIAANIPGIEDPQGLAAFILSDHPEAAEPIIQQPERAAEIIQQLLSEQQAAGTAAAI